MTVWVPGCRRNRLPQPGHPPAVARGRHPSHGRTGRTGPVQPCDGCRRAQEHDAVLIVRDQGGRLACGSHMRPPARWTAAPGCAAGGPPWSGRRPGRGSAAPGCVAAEGSAGACGLPLPAAFGVPGSVPHTGACDSRRRRTECRRKDQLLPPVRGPAAGARVGGRRWAGRGCLARGGRGVLDGAQRGAVAAVLPHRAGRGPRRLRHRSAQAPLQLVPGPRRSRRAGGLRRAAAPRPPGRRRTAPRHCGPDRLRHPRTRRAAPPPGRRCHPHPPQLRAPRPTGRAAARVVRGARRTGPGAGAVALSIRAARSRHPAPLRPRPVRRLDAAAARTGGEPGAG